MSSNRRANEAHPTLLLQWMNAYGDAIVRTCYLLTGDCAAAHRVARQVFCTAGEQLDDFFSQQNHEIIAWLLRITMQLCPCRDTQTPCLPARRDPFLSWLQTLTPHSLRIALLHYYHGLSPSEAAWVLNMDEPLLLSTLKRLTPP